MRFWKFIERYYGIQNSNLKIQNSNIQNRLYRNIMRFKIQSLMNPIPSAKKIITWDIGDWRLYLEKAILLTWTLNLLYDSGSVRAIQVFQIHHWNALAERYLRQLGCSWGGKIYLFYTSTLFIPLHNSFSTPLALVLVWRSIL